MAAVAISHRTWLTSPREGLGRDDHRESNIVFMQRLADRIALIVMPAAREGEQLRFQVGKPRGAFRQEDLSRFELRRRDRHAALFVANRLYRDDPRDLANELLNQSCAGRGVLDEDASSAPFLREALARWPLARDSRPGRARRLKDTSVCLRSRPKWCTLTNHCRGHLCSPYPNSGTSETARFRAEG